MTLPSIVNLYDYAEKLDFDTPKSLPRLGVFKVMLHALHILLAFINMCITATVIATQKSYNGSGQAAPNYTVAVAIITLFVSVPLTVFPWNNMSNHGFVKTRGFFLRPRTTVIFTCFLTLAWFAAMISMTVHSKNPANCALDSDLEDNASYVKAWSNQCNCAKASAAFSWICFFVAVATAVCSAILLWHEKKLRHAEIAKRNAEKTPSEQDDGASSHFDDDARTIVDMKYSEKDKHPVVSYEESANGIQEDMMDHSQLQEGNTGAYIPSPPMPSAPPMAAGNSFASPYSPTTTPSSTVVSPPYIPAQTYSPIITAPYTPGSIASPTVPYAAGTPTSQAYSPYIAPYVSTSGSPLSYHSSSPSYPAQQQPYHSTASPVSYQPYQSSPLSYQANSVMSPPVQQQQQQPYYQQQPQQPPKEYQPYLALV